MLRPAIGSAMIAAAHAVRLAGPHGLADLRSWGAAAPVLIAARRGSDRVAMLRGGRSITAGDLEAQVRHRAAAVAAAHPPGTRLGVDVDGGIDGVINLLAAVVAGCDAIPLGPRLAPSVAARWRVPVAAGKEAHRQAAPGGRPGRLLPLSTGTTGDPTPAAAGLPLGEILRLADLDRRIRMPSGRVLLLAPPDHGHGLSVLLAALAHGLEIDLASGLPRSAQHAAFDADPAMVSGVPDQLARLDAPGRWAGIALVLSGSSPLPGDLADRIRAAGTRVVDAYGTTETGTVVIDGVPVAGTTIRLDDERRVMIRTASVEHRTSDRGDITADGRLRILGRLDGLIDAGGETVDPRRVELAILAIPGVRTAEVSIEPRQVGGGLVATIAVSGDLDEPTVRAALQPMLGRAEMPRRFLITR